MNHPGNVPSERERAFFWRAADLGDMEMLRATYITHAFTRHTHDTFAIGVIERGAEAFSYRHANHTAPAGHIVLINPGEVHTGSSATSAGWAYRMLYPSGDLLRRASSELAGYDQGIPYFTAAVARDDALASLLHTLHVTLERSASALERESLLLTTFAHLLLRHAELRPHPHPIGAERSAVALARDYIQAHYADNVTLDQLSAIASLSPFHFLRVFQREIGLPPHAYLTQARLARAKALLSLGLPIPQVAVETGFVDQSHLTRHFKRLVGVTPGQYVSANASGSLRSR